MTKYVALLRGINVSGNKKVEMSKLKKVFESLGFNNVSTYINSGNVIFESPKKDFKNIEPTLKHTFGFEINVVIRDAKNIHKLTKAISPKITNDAEQKADVLFLWDKFDSKNTISKINVNTKVDNLKYNSGAIVWSIKRENHSKSGMNKFIGTEVYRHMTARNINTVRKLAELMK